MIRGFDVSETSGFLDDVFWQAAVDQGMKFVYVRCSWGNGHEDSQFRYNVQKAHEYGLKVGAYHYDYSLQSGQTAAHARKCAQIIADAGVLLELPVFFDLEDADLWKQRNNYTFAGDTATAQCIEWINNIGLNTGIYSSYGWLECQVEDNSGYSGDGRPISWRDLGCAVWNAEWGPSDDLQGYVWQDAGDVVLAGHYVDLDYMYDDALFN